MLRLVRTAPSSSSLLRHHAHIASINSRRRYSTQAAAPAQAEQPAVDEESVTLEDGTIITPWEVRGPTADRANKDIDYEGFVKRIGASMLDEATLQRWQRATGEEKLHTFVRRGVFFAHRDLDMILNKFETHKARLEAPAQPAQSSTAQGQPSKVPPFYLYTGRGPSSESMHVGHLVPFMFSKYLQQAFNVPIVIQLTDDEKYLWKDYLKTPEQVRRLAYENARDIIACGFDPEKTFIFSNLDYMGELYPNVLRIQRCVTASNVQGIFGFQRSDNIGKYAFPAVQAAPCLSTSFQKLFGFEHYNPEKPRFLPCLIPCAIDQDPYFKLTRQIAHRLGAPKPALLHARFFPSLQGMGQGKMSASDSNSAIFLTDTPKQIADKIKRFAYSGGGLTLEEHRQKGANLDVDVSFKYLNFFCDDDALIADVAREYGSGRMLTSEVKQLLIQCLQKLIAEHYEKRAAVTDDVIREFMSVRRLKL